MSLFQQFSDIKSDFELAQLSSFKIGGRADFFWECRDIQLLPEVLKLAQSNSLPVFVVGGGSNTVFADEGFRGLVIKMSNFDLDINHQKIRASAGLVLNALIMQVLRHNLIGFEKLFGIPGTLGGAIRGNAGANGQEISDHLESVDYLDLSDLQIKTKLTKELDFTYRTSWFKNQHLNGHPMLILSANFNLQIDTDLAKKYGQEIFQIQKIRLQKYPNEPNCGSFFKNPYLTVEQILSIAQLTQTEISKIPFKNSQGEITEFDGINGVHIPAAWLIEKAALKGTQSGDAQISNQHGNFLINIGQAKMADLQNLVNLINEKLQSKFGIQLEKEVQTLDQFGAIIS